MNHTEARQALLVRAFETPPSPPWTEADRDWADRETVRAEGADAVAQALIARRGALATERLASSEPAVRTALSLTAGIGWAGWLVPLAFVFGLAMDALGPQRRINLFALPLLGMLAWNALVYLGLLAHALSVLMRRQQPVVAQGPLRLALSRWSAALGRALQRLSGPPLSPPLLRFMTGWWAVSRSMQMARLAALLHLAAAALAAGALVSMYSRGVFFDFRAGWESTFFDAEAMHRAISWLLGPASRASGVALPGLAEFAALRFPDSEGESAGRWIHLFAITVAGAVLLPRLLLAASAGWQARRLARRFPLALDDAYFSRLVRGLRGDIVEAQVLPYSYQVAPALHAGVQQVLHSRLGATVHLQWLATVPLGGEDDLDAHLAQPLAASLLVALFSLTATPEREVHAAFLRLLAARLASGAELMVLIDESAFRDRFAGSDGELRLQQRREAWRQLLREIDLTPVFADLSVQEETS